jgi:CRP/FNR family transcriptional regulator, cyclic AMP receptor protein
MTSAATANDPMRLPDEVQAMLLDLSRIKPLVAGESLFLKGSMPDALFGVVSGCLRVSVSAENGRQAVISLLEPGHWFGEVSLLIGRQRVYDIVAVEPGEVAIVNAEDFHQLIQERPDVHMAFTRLVCFRLRVALSWIDDVILMPLAARLAKRMLSLETRVHDCATMLGVSQEDLAAMLGVSRQSVNRQLRQWEAEGLVRLHYGRIELLDAEALLRVS